MTDYWNRIDINRKIDTCIGMPECFSIVNPIINLKITSKALLIFSSDFKKGSAVNIFVAFTLQKIVRGIDLEKLFFNEMTGKLSF